MQALFDHFLYFSIIIHHYLQQYENSHKATPGDILYSVVGTFGVPVQIKKKKKFVFQRHIAILRPNKDVVLPEYLYYVMKSGSFYAQADAFAIGSAQRTKTKKN